MTMLSRFLPDRYRSVGLFVAALVVVTVVCLPAIGARFGYNDPNTQTFASEFFGSGLSFLAASKLVSTLVIVAFWGAIGFLVYLVTWVGSNFMIEVRNQATMDTEYTNRSSLVSSLRQPLLHFAMGLVLMVGVIATTLSLKLWNIIGIRGVSILPTPLGVCYFLVAVLGFALCLYATAILWALTRWVADGRPDSGKNSIDMSA